MENRYSSAKSVLMLKVDRPRRWNLQYPLEVVTFSILVSVVRPSVCPSVHPSVRPSIRPSVRSHLRFSRPVTNKRNLSWNHYLPVADTVFNSTSQDPNRQTNPDLLTYSSPPETATGLFNIPPGKLWHKNRSNKLEDGSNCYWISLIFRYAL